MKEVQILASPAKKHARKVEKEDYKRVLQIFPDMVKICFSRRGPYFSAHAIAHSQVDKDDPLRFFVKADGRVIINPKILEKNDKMLTNREGCYSFPFRGIKKTLRHESIKVWFKEMVTKKKEGSENEYEYEIKTRTRTVEGLEAFIFQHEVDHMNSKCIY